MVPKSPGASSLGAQTSKLNSHGASGACLLLSHAKVPKSRMNSANQRVYVLAMFIGDIQSSLINSKV